MTEPDRPLETPAPKPRADLSKLAAILIAILLTTVICVVVTVLVNALFFAG